MKMHSALALLPAVLVVTGPAVRPRPEVKKLEDQGAATTGRGCRDGPSRRPRHVEAGPNGQPRGGGEDTRTSTSIEAWRPSGQGSAKVQSCLLSEGRRGKLKGRRPLSFSRPARGAKGAGRARRAEGRRAFSSQGASPCRNGTPPPRRRPRTGRPASTPSPAPCTGASPGAGGTTALAEFLDALGNPETTAAAAPADMNRLTERATHLLQALQHQHDPGVLETAPDRLEEAVLRESEAPVAAGVFRRLLDALANIGL